MLLHLLQLGRVSYTEGLSIMRQVAEARRGAIIGDTLLLMEHSPVLTLGRNANRSHLLASEAFLALNDVELHEVDRGGDITYHGPGQLVGYPIFDLRGDLPGKRGPHLGPVDFVRLLEEAIILTCKDFGVPTQRVKQRTGVWTLAGGTLFERKICAIGIHVSQAITTHGFALNVTTDLRDYEWIVPCGIPDRGVTSLEQEVQDPTELSMPAAGDAVARNLGRVFGRHVLASKTLQQLLNLSNAHEHPDGLSPPV